jgi:hypothetical protein
VARLDLRAAFRIGVHRWVRGCGTEDRSKKICDTFFSVLFFRLRVFVVCRTKSESDVDEDKGHALLFLHQTVL